MALEVHKSGRYLLSITCSLFGFGGGPSKLDEKI